MKKSISAIALTLALAVSGAIPADAAKFKNCTAVNKVYKGGVAKSINTVNQGGKTKNDPFVNAKLYKSLKSMDRDKDGIACEK
jgi:hypothetical protein